MSTSLEDLSNEMRISPSGLRKRIHALGLEVDRGSRGKWCIPDDILEVLREADRLMKEGAGAATTRRVLGLDSARAATANQDSEAEAPAASIQLQQALSMLAAERERSEALQARVNQLMGRVAELTGACAMFQERTRHLANNLQAAKEDKPLAAEPAQAGRLTVWWQSIARRREEA